MEMTPTVVGLAAGAIDQYLENNDTSHARTKTLSQYATWFEIGTVVIGNFGDSLGLGQYKKYTEPLAVAGAAILGKKLYTAVRSTSPAASNVQQQANMVARNAFARQVRESTIPEFQGMRSF